MLQIATNKEKDSKLLYPKLSYEIVGMCFEVHNELGQFAREKQYANLVEQKLKNKGIKYERECPLGDSGNIVDFVIENKIVLELKTVRVLGRTHYRQLQNYLQQTKVELGLLLNFSDKLLSPKRVLKV
ncbi:MAG: hypothetical protein A3F53_01390 [Candidatus Zambryskibacteria bacterium RIFCSPHIGHO2_12_FULL_48_10]|uniref:GxxExxY protein n=1 Tax=Candidatus Zambryskibacteria bacterium RIFCSPHIGHO2_01_FULL_46_25 TaxID=1802738 RepID=A0A1G2SZS9_9BACT|nr:MAG: hypothetical protein A2838_01065 [Candidatus Zambryskibacteria bacterium RIFCSPHIGHO2_01_FULL_46_25]OHB00953.1 MAG: hypothetical protein A3F53_01390 [Candidatus Zambryskibacteria bacterium RIFCSPHIGHO2_12_FULL_48_10]HCR52284.1 GxxExxY protein [Candidatus Kaiserbacteria bacterium]